MGWVREVHRILRWDGPLCLEEGSEDLLNLSYKVLLRLISTSVDGYSMSVGISDIS